MSKCLNCIEYERGWLEASIDGEGTIGARKAYNKTLKHETYHPIVLVYNTVESFVEKAKNICGGVGKITPKDRSNDPNANTPFAYLWSMPISIQRLILPQLRLLVKEKQRLLALELLSLVKERGHQRDYTDDDFKRMKEIYEELKSLNSGKARYG